MRHFVRKSGEALQAERMSLEEILDLREQTLDYIFAAQWPAGPQPERRASRETGLAAPVRP